LQGSQQVSSSSFSPTASSRSMAALWATVNQ